MKYPFSGAMSTATLIARTRWLYLRQRNVHLNKKLVPL
jgi:hypothetical protein